MYKVKKDGSQQQQIESNNAKYVYVINDWIYAGTDYRIKKDGSNKEHLHTRNSAPGYTLNIVGDWIYFYDTDEEDEEAIFKMRTDGSKKEKIYSGRTDYMNVNKNWIYFVKYDDNALYKMKDDGSEEQLLLDEKVSNINVYDDWIYYNGKSNDEHNLKRVKTDGSNNQSI